MEISPLASSVKNQISVVGHKGGESSPKAPVEAPDSLASIATARTLDLISEGEIYGLVNGMRSVFLDETPLANEDGSINFSGVTLDTRNGTQDQEYIKGYPSVESETNVGLVLKASQPYVKTFSNNQLSGARIRLSTNRFATVNTSNGNTDGARVEYTINLRTGNGPYVEYLKSAFDGKKASGVYERSHRINFPESNAGWTIQVVRNTPDSVSDNVSDTINITSTTEVIDAKFRYPNSALVGLQFDASQFQSIPPRAFYIRGIKIKVPSNYDPETRTYAGTWNGTFKVAYSDNPAWIYYDLVLSDRYGLGHMIKPFQMDRYELYRVAQYCDVMVSDGKGGMEPRFACCLYLQKRADALRVIQDLAGLFRGLTFWGNGQAVVSCDMPSDPVYTYTCGNVIDGKFERMGSKATNRYSVALVSWNDMSDFGRSKVEYVEDSDSLTLFGHRQTELAGIGCKSQGQAQRLGRWALLTNKLETDTITFSVGLDGTLVRPGAVVRIADNKRAGRRIGGRLRSFGATWLTLDGDTHVKPGDSIHVTRSDNGLPVSRVVKSTLMENGFQVINVDALPSLPAPQGVWAHDSAELVTEQYRILNIAEAFSGNKMSFKVSATRHVPGKFNSIDNGTLIESPPITVIPPSVQEPTKNVTLVSDYSIDQGNVLTTMTINWDMVPHAVAYEVQWKVNNGSWNLAGRTGTTSMDVQGILPGRYQARVQAFNSMGLGSIWANSIEYRLESRNVPPPLLAYLKTDKLVMGIGIEWGFPAGIDVTTTQRVEIWYSPEPDITGATKQGEYSYPTNKTSIMGLAGAVQFFFWGRMVDKLGNVGQFTGPIVGMSEDDPGIILEYLKGQITATQLAKDLLDKINAEPDLSGIEESINELKTNYDNLEQSLTDLAKSSSYDPDKTYGVNSTVKVGDSLWTARVNVPVNTPPPNPAYWINSGSVTNQFEATVTQVNKNTTDITKTNDQLTLESTRLDGVVLELDGKASSSALDQLSNTVMENGQDIQAVSDSVEGVKTSLDGKASSSALQQTNTRVEQQGRDISSQADKLGIVEAQLTDVETEVNASSQAIDSISTKVQQQDQKIQTSAERVSTIEVKISPPMAGSTKFKAGSSRVKAGVYSLQSAIGDSSLAIGKRVDTVDAQIGDLRSSASITSQATVNLQNEVSSSINIKTSTTSGGRTFISGIGVGTSNVGGIIESQVLVAASRFAVLDPNGSDLLIPFVIQGGQVILDQALIQRATIQNLLVGNTFTSVAVNSSGQPLMVMNLQTGQFILRATSGAGRTEQTNQAFLVYDVNGTLRTRMGMW